MDASRYVSSWSPTKDWRSPLALPIAFGRILQVRHIMHFSSPHACSQVLDLRCRPSGLVCIDLIMQSRMTCI